MRHLPSEHWSQQEALTSSYSGTSGVVSALGASGSRDMSRQLTPCDEDEDSDDVEGDRSTGEFPFGDAEYILSERGEDPDKTDALEEWKEADEIVELVDDLANICPSDRLKGKLGLASILFDL